MTLYYCYDAYCGWCYGFSKVITQIWMEYKDRMSIEVLSGQMIPKTSAKPIGVIAPFIRQAYKTVENTSGIVFGSDFLWHIFNPEQSDWVPHSETPAIALTIFKEQFPDQQVPFAVDLEEALHLEGRDLTDPEAYRHLLFKYGIDPTAFYKKLQDPLYVQKAQEEAALCSQLQVTGFPKLLLQTQSNKFFEIAEGYTPYDQVQDRLSSVLNLLAPNQIHP